MVRAQGIIAIGMIVSIHADIHSHIYIHTLIHIQTYTPIYTHSVTRLTDLSEKSKERRGRGVVAADKTSRHATVHSQYLSDVMYMSTFPLLAWLRRTCLGRGWRGRGRGLGKGAMFGEGRGGGGGREGWWRWGELALGRGSVGGAGWR